jgi:DNA-binding NarL/FixJ family response regulator
METALLLAAFDHALEAIALPALLVSLGGEILYANGVAGALLDPDRQAIERSLAAAVAGQADGAMRESTSVWELTPLAGHDAQIGFLAILRGAPPPSPALDEALRAAGGRWKLTARQREVMELVGKGLTNDLIAETLGIGKGTVEYHLSGIFDKAGVSNRSTLIVSAFKVAR